MPGLNLEYELQPQSKVHATLQMPLNETTSATEIYGFIRHCSLLSVVGLQTLIHLGNLISPSPSDIERFQLEIEKVFKISRTTLYRLRKEGGFPAGVQVRGRWR